VAPINGRETSAMPKTAHPPTGPLTADEFAESLAAEVEDLLGAAPPDQHSAILARLRELLAAQALQSGVEQ
jgi:hypothetical protein